MTCREFKHGAAALTLWELTRGQGEQLTSHADGCEACAAWLRKQRSLASSMRTLQAQTVSLEAGPAVEQNLLAAFRQVRGTSPALALVGAGHRSQAVPPSRVTPIAMRLSRVFEIGAYVAVAAAIMVGVFLGARLLQKPAAAPVQSGSIAATAPVAQTPGTTVPKTAETAPVVQPATSTSRSRSHRVQPNAAAKTAADIQADETESAQATSDDGYVALMFCDPLSCAADSQVVRMELPATGAAQPQMADVVVGYDGVVRAVRIVN